MKKDEITIVVNAPVERVREWLAAHMSQDWYKDGYYGRVGESTFQATYHTFSAVPVLFSGRLEKREEKTVVSGEFRYRRLVLISLAVLVCFLLVVVVSGGLILGLLVLLLSGFPICQWILYRIERRASRRSRQKIQELLTQLKEAFQ